MALFFWRPFLPLNCTGPVIVSPFSSKITLIFTTLALFPVGVFSRFFVLDVFCVWNLPCSRKRLAEVHICEEWWCGYHDQRSLLSECQHGTQSALRVAPITPSQLSISKFVKFQRSGREILENSNARRLMEWTRQVNLTINQQRNLGKSCSPRFLNDIVEFILERYCFGNFVDCCEGHSTSYSCDLSHQPLPPAKWMSRRYLTYMNGDVSVKAAS